MWNMKLREVTGPLLVIKIYEYIYFYSSKYYLTYCIYLSIFFRDFKSPFLFFLIFVFNTPPPGFWEVWLHDDQRIKITHRNKPKQMLGPGKTKAKQTKWNVCYLLLGKTTLSLTPETPETLSKGHLFWFYTDIRPV